MLERKDVAHLIKHWHMQPTPEVCEEAVALTNQFSRSDSIAILCAGLSAIALYSGDDHYRKLSTALFNLGLKHGQPVEKLMPWHVPEDGLRNNVYPIGVVSQFAFISQEKDLRVGFLHGHYRFLTPASWTNVLVAREKCDLLILGLEDGWRTREYKGVDTTTKDWQRWQWVLASGFDGYLTRISRSEYIDRGYEGILRRIKPDIYFGNFSIPQERQQEMARRATMCGAIYMALPEQEGLHTSEYFNEK